MAEKLTKDGLTSVELRLLERAYGSGYGSYNLFDSVESMAASILNARGLAIVKRDAGYPVIEITPAGRAALSGE